MLTRTTPTGVAHGPDGSRIVVLCLGFLLSATAGADEAPTPPETAPVPAVEASAPTVADPPSKTSRQNVHPNADPVALVVTGTRTARRASEDPAGTERIGAHELKTRGVRDLSRALDGEPGVQVERSFRGSSFQLRGLDAKYTRVLIDGQPVVGQVNDVIDLRRYPVDAVDRIEVVRGSASALYGSDAVGGVVHVLSRRPRRPLELGGVFQYGGLNRSVASGSVGMRRGDWSVLSTLQWMGNDAYDLTPGDANLSTQGDARAAGTGSLRLFWRPNVSVPSPTGPEPAVDVQAFVRGGAFDTRGIDLQLPRALFNRRVNEQDVTAGAQAQLRTGSGVRLALYTQHTSFWRQFFRQQRMVESSPEDQRSRETQSRMELQVDGALGAHLHTLLGAGGHWATFQSPRLRGGEAAVPVAWTFTQVEWSPARWFELLGGVRLDWDGQFGRHWSPRVAARVSAGPERWGVSIRGSYGEGFRAPSFGERFLDFRNPVANYTVSGNPALVPESSRGEQLGVEWTPRSDPDHPPPAWVPTLKVTWHHTRLNHLIQARELPGSSAFSQLFRYANATRAEVSGLEVGLRLAIGATLVADLGGAFLDAQAEDEGRRTPLPGRARWQYSRQILWHTREGGIEAVLRAQSQWGRTALADGTTLPPLTLIDARIAVRVWNAARGRSELQVFAQIDNLANQTDPLFLALPGMLGSLGMQGRY